MRLRSRHPHQELHVSSLAPTNADARRPQTRVSSSAPTSVDARRPQTRMRTRSSSTSLAVPSCLPRRASSSNVNPRPVASGGARRSRRVATFHTAQRQQQQQTRSRLPETDTSDESDSECTAALSPVVTRVRRTPTKVPSAVVPATVTRAAQNAKRRGSRLSTGSDERKRLHLWLLQSALSSDDDTLDDTSWLTGTLMDLLLWRVASQYPLVHFLPTDFFHCFLESRSRLHHTNSSRTQRTTTDPSADYVVHDVLGRTVDYTSDRPVVFAINSGLVHWNLLRVQVLPVPELQLFEPMGRLATRTGLTYRSVPRSVVAWLDACYPQHARWLTRAVSAITTPQQVSGFDCGVACLLYATKCAQGETREQINAQTDQRAITRFRRTLQQQLRAMQNSSEP